MLRQLWHDYQASLLLVVAGLVALLVLAGRAAPYAVLPAGAAPTVAWRLTAVGAGGLAGMVWTVCVVNGGPDLFVVLPFAALGVAGGPRACSPPGCRCERPSPSWPWSSAPCVVAGRAPRR